jgi:hypothetical protein
LEDADLYVMVILKWNVRYGEIGSGLLDSHVSGQVPVVSSCDSRNKTSDPIKGRNLLNEIRISAI